MQKYDNCAMRSSAAVCLRKNLPDLRLETHIQHPVSLIHDQIRNQIEIHRPHLQEIIQTPGRCHNHLCWQHLAAEVYLQLTNCKSPELLTF